MSSQEMLFALAWHDDMEEDGEEDADEHQEMIEIERPRRSNKRWFTVSVISALFVIWVIVKKTRL